MVDIAQGRPQAPPEPSIAELVRRAAEQVSRLARDELALARAEMATKGRRAGLGAGLLGASGVIGLSGVGVLLAAAVLALALVVPAWLAALIVAVVLLATAAVLALVGRSRVWQAAPPVPMEAMHSLQADIDEVRRRVHR